MDKYQKLAEDLTNARKAGERAAGAVTNTSDLFLITGGVLLYLPKWERERVHVAAVTAGVKIGLYERFGVREWAFNSREQLQNEQQFYYLQAFERHLKQCGYCVTSNYSSFSTLKEFKKSL